MDSEEATNARAAGHAWPVGQKPRPLGLNSQAKELIESSERTWPEEGEKRGLQGQNHQDWFHLCPIICLLLSPLPPVLHLRSQLSTPKGPYPPKATSSSCTLFPASCPSTTLPPSSFHLVVYAMLSVTSVPKIPHTSHRPPWAGAQMALLVSC